MVYLWNFLPAKNASCCINICSGLVAKRQSNVSGTVCYWWNNVIDGTIWLRLLGKLRGWRELFECLHYLQRDFNTSSQYNMECALQLTLGMISLSVWVFLVEFLPSCEVFRNVWNFQVLSSAILEVWEIHVCFSCKE